MDDFDLSTNNLHSQVLKISSQKCKNLPIFRIAQILEGLNPNLYFAEDEGCDY